MTIQDLAVVSVAYVTWLAAVVYFTRPTRRRFAGALAGGAAVGFVLPPVIALVASLGWWSVPVRWTPTSIPMLYLAIVLGCTPLFLISWRIDRRFRANGLAIFVAIAALIGVARSYAIAAIFPEWMVISSGVAPALAIAATYAGIVALGHSAMHLIAGPSQADELVRLSDSSSR